MKAVFKLGILSIIFTFIFVPEIFSQISLLTEHDIKPALYGQVFYPGDNDNYSAIVVLHGSGGLTKNYEKYKKYALSLAKNGYAVLLIDLYAETGAAGAGSNKRFEMWETWQKILKNGIKYLKGLPKINIDRIGVIGFSRGAWITLTTISTIPDIKVFINYYGVGRQSINNVTSLPPTLMLYGKEDMYADSSFILSAYNILKFKSENVELILYEDAGHGFNLYINKKNNKTATIDAYRNTILFLDRYLKVKID